MHRMLVRLQERRVLVGLFFAVLLIIGLGVHNDYGVSSDEPALKKYGHDVFDYLFHSGPEPTELDWQFHGPIIQVMMAASQRALHLSDGAEIWFNRHLMSFLIFFTGVVFFYLLAQRYTQDWRLALLGSAMLVLSPRIFAHGFYNPKDMPAMVFFIISAYTLLLVLERPSILRILSHALATGILISLRTFGLIILVLGVFFLIVDACRKRRSITIPFVYVLSVILLTIAVWPVLWQAPLQNFLRAVVDNTTRTGGGFYFGELITSVPWHYVPVWIAITTPPIITTCFLIGFVAVVMQGLRRPIGFLMNEREHVLSFAWMLMPLIALWTMSIGIFDEWRHVMFVYPAMLLIALDGIVWLLSWGLNVRRAVVGVLSASLIWTGIWMIRFHPFEYAYFSIPAAWADGKFELDYWNLSYRAGLEYILATDARDKINVFALSRTAIAGADTLPLSEWNRLYFVDPDEADYILDNFRGNGYRKLLPAQTALHSIVVDGVTILTIYKGPQTNEVVRGR